MPSKANNQEIAETLANSESFLTNLSYIVEYDTFYLWRDNYFKKLEGYELKKIMHMAVVKSFPTVNITDSFLIDVVKSLRYYVNQTHLLPDFSRIAFSDRTLNLQSFKWEEHSKQKMTVLSLPFHSEDVNKSAPVWENFLKTSLVIKGTILHDQELIDFAQEMFGYFMLPGLRGASAFFLVGEGSNGKSVMVKVLEDIFTKEFCSNMNIQTLTTDKFMKAGLVGKVINISSEEESKYIRADVLKALVTGDTITAQRKFGDGFSFTPNCKFVFCTNEMPSFDTFNYGLKRRIKFIPFYRIFKDAEQDKELQEKLREELPAIVGWALAGAKRFVANGRVFNQAKSSIEKLESFVEELSSALPFFKEFYTIDDSQEFKTANEIVYDKYKTWCQDNGRKPMNSNNFWKDLGKEYEDKLVECWTHLSDENGRRSVKAKNITLKSDIEEPAAEISVETLPF